MQSIMSDRSEVAEGRRLLAVVMLYYIPVLTCRVLVWRLLDAAKIELAMGCGV